MGTVYRQTGRCNQVLAVKINRLRTPKGYVFIENEAEILSQLNHPNIIKVQAHGVGEKGPFIAMELVKAKDLWAHLGSEGRLSVKDAIDVADKVADALAYLREKGILHMDIKPANILWKKARGGESSIVKLIDFAFARKTDEWHVVEDGGKVFIGSTQYASLERLTGKKPKERDDIVSLGLVLFTVLLGERVVRNDKYFAEHSMLGIRIGNADLPMVIKKLLWDMTGTSAKGEIRKYKISNCKQLKRRIASIKKLLKQAEMAEEVIPLPVDLIPQFSV